MEIQIKVGSIVKIKENDRRMGLNKITGGEAECVYHDERGVPHTEIHNLVDLILLS